MVENLLKVIHILAGLQHAENWECLTCMGCNQQRLVPDSARTRSWSGDSKDYCVRDFDADLDMKFFMAKYDGAADGNSNNWFCSVLNSGRGTGRIVWVTRFILWRRLRHHCPMYNVSLCTHTLQISSIFNKCLYFSYDMAGFFLEKPCILPVSIETALP